MKPERPLFDSSDAAAEVEADARADSDVREGRLISHDAVRRWVATWGSNSPSARPRIGD